MQVLSGEVILKFSDYFQYLPQTNGCWNCGFTIVNNQFWFSARNEVSRYNQEYFCRTTPANLNPRAVPVLVKFNNNLELISTDLVNKSEDRILSDVRIFTWNNEVYYTGTERSSKPQPDGKRRVDQFLAKSIGSYLVFLKFDHSFDLPQKNWTPIASGNKLFFENFEQKGCLSRQLMHYDSGSLKLVRQESCEHKLRGNSQVISFNDDYFLGLYHFHTRRFYYHYFALLSKEFPFPLIRLSNPFRFPYNNTIIQFGMGMDSINDDIYISYGVQDADNFLLKTNRDNILQLFT